VLGLVARDATVCVQENGGDTCASPAKRGERCLLIDDVGTNYSRSCLPELRCVWPSRRISFVRDGMCVPPLTERLAGEPCDQSWDCADGLACSPRTSHCVESE
jgi:hypothetical protein